MSVCITPGCRNTKTAALLMTEVALCRGENKQESDMNVYGTSKIHLIMASKALNEKLKGTGVEVFAAHPGKLVTSPSCKHP